MKLSEHFTLAEMTHSGSASRRGIENIPDKAAIANMKRLCYLMEEIRSYFAGAPIRVTSGYRSPAVNKLVNGSKHSAHLTGRAIDFQIDGYTPHCVATEIRKNKGVMEDIDQLILEFNRWVHIGIAPVGVAPRRQVFSYKFVDGKKTLIQGIRS